MTTAMFSPRQIEILDELSAIVSVEGFRNLTVADLADRLRCSRRTLYTLAPSRDDLILGVVERLFERWTAHAGSAAGAADDAVAAVAAYLAADLQVCDALPVFFDDVEEIVETSAVLQQFRSDRLRRVAELVARADADGTARCCDATIMAEMLDAMTERLRALRQRHPPALDAPRALRVLHDLVECWLGPSCTVAR